MSMIHFYIVSSIHRTVPVPVNLGLKDLKKEIDRVVNNTRCELKGAGSTR